MLRELVDSAHRVESNLSLSISLFFIRPSSIPQESLRQTLPPPPPPSFAVSSTTAAAAVPISEPPTLICLDSLTAFRYQNRMLDDLGGAEKGVS
jgi:hypothetical protein